MLTSISKKIYIQYNYNPHPSAPDCSRQTLKGRPHIINVLGFPLKGTKVNKRTIF
jgi:hypothetical protein